MVQRKLGYVNATQTGAKKRVRNAFTTKGEAAAYEKFTMRDVEDKLWVGDKPDHRRLSDVIELWFKLYGKTLANGSVIYQKFHHMVEAMGNPLASL